MNVCRLPKKIAQRRCQRRLFVVVLIPFFIVAGTQGTSDGKGVTIPAAVQDALLVDPFYLVLLSFLLVIFYCITLLKTQRQLKINHQTVMDSLQMQVYSISQSNNALKEDVAHLKASKETLTQLIKHQNKEIQEKTIEKYRSAISGIDPLTSLPNRSLFMDRLDQSLTRTPWHNRHLGICYLNVDHFKGVNDRLGYHIGDLLLKSIGERLSLALRPGDTIARMEGNAFAILCVDLAKGQDLTKIAQTVLEIMSKPVSIENNEVYSTVSIGISLSPEDGEGAERLLQHAETAHARAKRMGRNNWQYYSKEVNQSMLFEVEMENCLRHALERNELRLYYQPKLDMASNLVVGCEALLRWQHPRLGLVHPKEFIPLAEEIGLIIPIGEWVIMEACIQCKAWQQQVSPDFSMAVNLSARQFQRGNLAHQVRQTLDRSGLSPNCLELELTESMTQCSKEEMETLSELSEMGVLIGVDDFGIGFSSLMYLKQLPISFIKIDPSFVSGIPTNIHDMAITTAIIQLGHSLHLKVIAEGVEDTDQMEFLRGLHCDLIQGYLIGKPNSPDSFANYHTAKKFYVAEESLDTG